jgi:hypothetical protein
MSLPDEDVQVDCRYDLKDFARQRLPKMDPTEASLIEYFIYIDVYKDALMCYEGRDWQWLSTLYVLFSTDS